MNSLQMQEKSIELRDGIKLKVKISEKDFPVWLIHIHGIGEHSGRHSYIEQLFGSKYNIFQYDLRGHGLSEGQRGYVKSFDQYIDDLVELITYLVTSYKMKRYVLTAHSMGALIAADFIQNRLKDLLYPEIIHLNGPPVYPGGFAENIVKILPSKVLSNLSNLPLGVNVSGLVNLDLLSHNQVIKQDFINDSSNCLKLHTRLLLNLAAKSKSVFSKPLRAKCPAYVTIGSADQVVSYSECVKFFSVVDKSFKLKVFPNAYHEIHNEISEYKDPYFKYLKEIL